MKLVVAVAAGGLALAVLALFFAQRALLFPAPRPPRTPQPQLGELIRLPSTVALWSPLLVWCELTITVLPVPTVTTFS